jgi:hypothetical protein
MRRFVYLVSLSMVALVVGVCVGAHAQIGAAAAQESRTETDVFTGRNVVGPYMLSWRAIAQDSERITRNGARLARGADYQINAAAGVITFARPLRSTDIARVDYRITAGVSQRNPAQVAIPLGLTLFSDQRNLLSLDAVYRPAIGDARSSVGSGAGGLELTLTGNFRHSALSKGHIRFFLDQRGGRLEDRGALQLSEAGRFRYGQYAVSLTHAGKEFARQAETGFLPGRQVADAQLTLNVVPRIQSTTTLQHVEDANAPGGSASTLSVGQRLSASTPSGTRVNASYLVTETASGAQKSMASKEILRLQGEQPLPANSSAALLLERVETTADGVGRVLQTSSVDIRSAPVPQLSLLGRYGNKLLPSGPEDFAYLRVEAEPGSRTRVTAEVSDRYTAQYAAQSRTAGFEYRASPAVALRGGLALADKGSEHAVARSVGATIRPAPPLELTGAVKLRERFTGGVSDPSEPDTLDVKVRMELARRALQVTGGFSNNPEDDKGAVARVMRQSVGLQSFWGAATLSGAYSVESAHAAALVSRLLDVKLGVSIGRYTTVYGSFKGSESILGDQRNTDVYGIGLVHRFGDRVDLSLNGAVTNRYLAGSLAEPPDYRAETRLRMRF